MKTLSKLTYRYLKLNKKKSLITIISIILITTLIFSVGLGASTVRKSAVDSIVEDEGPHHIELYDLDFSVLDKINNNSDIKEVGIIQTINSIEQDSYRIDFINVTDNLEKYFQNLQGQFPKNNTEIIISTKLAKKGNLKIGSTIDNKKVVGVFDYTPINNDSYNDLKTYYAYTTDSFRKNDLTRFLVTFKSVRHAYDKIAILAQDLNLERHIAYGNIYYDNAIINTELLNINGEYYLLGTTLGIYAIFSLVLIVISVFCILIVRNSFTISLSERKKQFGALRSIGASKKQIFKMVMIEASMISLIAIPIGIILSLGLVSTILAIFNKILEGISTPYQLYLYPEFIVISLIFIIITIYGSAFYPAIKASQVTPMEAIRGNDVYKLKKSKENYPLIEKIFGPEGEVAYKNMKRNRRKFTSSIISSCISIVLFITFATILNYALINYTSYEENDFDINIYIDKKAEQVIEKISNISNITNFVKYDTLYLSIKNSELFTNEYIDRNLTDSTGSYSIIYLVGLDNSIYQDYLKNIKAPKDTYGVIINNAYYRDRETREEIRYDIFQKNSDIYLELYDIQSEEVYKTIDNLYLSTEFDYFSLSSIPLIVNLDTFNEYQDQERDEIILGINTNDPIAFDNDMQELIDENPNIEINYNNYALYDYETQRLILSLKFILYVILFFISLISIMTIFSSINANIETREKEFSVLRSIGMSKEGLNKMLVLEGIFLGLKILLFAIMISMIIIWFIRDALKLMHLLEKSTIIPYPTKYLIFAIVFVLVLIFFVTMYSMHKIKKKNIVDSIKNDNI